MSSPKSIAQLEQDFANLLKPASQKEVLERKAEALMAEFLSRIDQAMEKQNVSKKELAKRIGTSPSFITQLFRGDRALNFKILAKMADALALEFKIVTAEEYYQRHTGGRKSFPAPQVPDAFGVKMAQAAKATTKRFESASWYSKAPHPSAEPVKAYTGTEYDLQAA